MNPKGIWMQQSEDEHWLIASGYAVYGKVKKVNNNYSWVAGVNYKYSLNQISGIATSLEAAKEVVSGLMVITKTTEQEQDEPIVETLTELLTRAVNGLEWWMEMHPEDVSRADYEFIEEAKMFIE